ncbi:MAG: hypothetical protein R3325_10595 [Thermoanaerobaculia bacterium]|nr:hypothetical protein [Thermoanaerobaculia bacterium]
MKSTTERQPSLGGQRNTRSRVGRLSWLLASVGLLTVAAPARAQTYELTGGRWFDGETFVTKTAYRRDGVLTFTEPPGIDETFDLAGGSVVPPFGEAHNHDLASGHEVEEQSDRYLWDGVYYVKQQSAFHTTAAAFREKLAEPTTVDAVFAFAPVTGPGGHPIRLRELFFDRGYYEGEFESKEEIAGVGYTLVADVVGELSENHFPERKIGHLREGFEASFLVLGGNPLDDFLQVANIQRRFKQGRWLEVPEPPRHER